MTKNENLLLMISEECAEIQQAVSKSLRFGLTNRHPNIEDSPTNETELLTEYFQLIAVMEMLFEKEILQQPNTDTIEQIKADKKQKVIHYQDMSTWLGCITN